MNVIKYTPKTRASNSLVERNDEIQELYMQLYSAVQENQELLPKGRLILRYSMLKQKKDRLSDQIDFLSHAVEDLSQPDTSFSDEVNDFLFANLETQISLCNADNIKLIDQITQSRLDNVTHTATLKFSTINVPLNSDLNQEIGENILNSYIEKTISLNRAYEKRHCQTNESSFYDALIKEENSEFEVFEKQSNEIMQLFEERIEEMKSELESNSQKLLEIKSSQKEMENDFQERLKLMRESITCINDRVKESDAYDLEMVHAITELFDKLQDPTTNDDDVKLVFKSILHLYDLKSETCNETFYSNGMSANRIQQYPKLFPSSEKINPEASIENSTPKEGSKPFKSDISDFLNQIGNSTPKEASKPLKSDISDFLNQLTPKDTSKEQIKHTLVKDWKPTFAPSNFEGLETPKQFEGMNAFYNSKLKNQNGNFMSQNKLSFAEPRDSIHTEVSIPQNTTPKSSFEKFSTKSPFQNSTPKSSFEMLSPKDKNNQSYQDILKTLQKRINSVQLTT